MLEASRIELLRDLARAIVLVASAFAVLFLIAGEDGAPGGPHFALLLIFVTATVAGRIVVFLKLPALLGMLFAGLLLRNLPWVGARVGARVDGDWSSAIKLLALTLILCRAGLTFDVGALKRLRFVLARLAVLPCLCEAAAITGLAVVLLDFPAPWALLLGFIVAAISPAVVVPSLLSLQERGFGTATGIPTMVAAAAPLDDVLAIAGFGICLSFSVRGTGPASPLWLDIARAPLELVAGLAAGLVCGLLAALLAPLRAPTPGAAAKTPLGAAALLLMLCVGSSLALKRAGLSGASALSVLVAAVVAARGWGPEATRPLSALLAQLWNDAAQPVLFGLVGSSVALDSLEARVVGLGLAMLACSVPVRCAVAYLAVGGRGLTWQERLFTAMAWMPKATVQAAIGGVALDEATSERERLMARDVLAVSVLSILCTAPLGAIAINTFGPRLLKQDGEGSAKDGGGGSDPEAAKRAALEAKCATEEAKGEAEEQL